MNGYKIVLLKAIFMLYRLPESERVCSGICSINSITKTGNIMFQFHKVRLKDTKQTSIRAKSLFQFHKVRLKASTNEVTVTETWFQFHKVRLKASNNSTLSARIVFQFHKVRLKVQVLMVRPLQVIGFNSIRYD